MWGRTKSFGGRVHYLSEAWLRMCHPEWHFLLLDITTKILSKRVFGLWLLRSWTVSKKAMCMLCVVPPCRGVIVIHNNCRDVVQHGCFQSYLCLLMWANKRFDKHGYGAFRHSRGYSTGHMNRLGKVIASMVSKSCLWYALLLVFTVLLLGRSNLNLRRLSLLGAWLPEYT